MQLLADGTPADILQACIEVCLELQLICLMQCFALQNTPMQMGCFALFLYTKLDRFKRFTNRMHVSQPQVMCYLLLHHTIDLHPA